MSETKETFLSSFKKQRQTQVDEVAEYAQRLVNLYRHVNSFNGDFPQELDEMLLSLSPEVLGALTNFVGGSTVRQYYDYLKAKKNPKNTETDTQNQKDEQTGYLPSPAEDEMISLPTATMGDSAQIEVLLKLLHVFL